jgi:hypothetical protein
MGSNNLIPASLHTSRNAARAAISKAITLESTSWYAPSTNLTLKSIIGKPAKAPVSFMLSMPFDTPGIYSLGIFPPTISLSKEYPSPGSAGLTIIFNLANCPAPPDCFLCV